VALLFGLIGACRSRLAGQVLTALLSVGLLLAGRSLVWMLAPDGSWKERLHTDPLAILTMTAVGLVIITVISASAASRAGATGFWQLASVSVLGVAAVLSLLLGWQRASTVGRSIFGDAAERAVFATAAAGKGLLLTGGELHLVQLRTRRPVLLDGGGLDALPYALESAPGMDRILREVYGMDLFNPPPEARGGGRVPSGVNRVVWERYTLDQWREIGRRYHVTQVLTEAGWRLDLPVVARSPGLQLYGIPE
jgi:hypothetical protein